MRTSWLGIALLAACTGRAAETAKRPTDGRPEHATLKYRKCAADSECVKVTDSCCDCANGGRVLAVARDQQAAFEASIVCNPNNPCNEMYGSCNLGKVRCEDGLCTFHETGFGQR